MCQKCSKFMLKNLSQSWLKQIASEYIYLVFYHICLTHKPSLGTYLISDSVYFWDSVCICTLDYCSIPTLTAQHSSKIKHQNCITKIQKQFGTTVCMYVPWRDGNDSTKIRFDVKRIYCTA